MTYLIDAIINKDNDLFKAVLKFDDPQDIKLKQISLSELNENEETKIHYYCDDFVVVSKNDIEESSITFSILNGETEIITVPFDFLLNDPVVFCKVSEDKKLVTFAFVNDGGPDKDLFAAVKINLDKEEFDVDVVKFSKAHGEVKHIHILIDENEAENGHDVSFLIHNAIFTSEQTHSDDFVKHEVIMIVYSDEGKLVRDSEIYQLSSDSHDTLKIQFLEDLVSWVSLHRAKASTVCPKTGMPLYTYYIRLNNLVAIEVDGETKFSIEEKHWVDYMDFPHLEDVMYLDSGYILSIIPETTGYSLMLHNLNEDDPRLATNILYREDSDFPLAMTYSKDKEYIIIQTSEDELTSIKLEDIKSPTLIKTKLGNQELDFSSFINLRTI